MSLRHVTWGEIVEAVEQAGVRADTPVNRLSCDTTYADDLSIYVMHIACDNEDYVTIDLNDKTEKEKDDESR